MRHRLPVCILRKRRYSMMGDAFPQQGEPGICGHRRLPVKCHTLLSSTSLWIQMTACLPSVDQVAPHSKGQGDHSAYKLTWGDRKNYLNWAIGEYNLAYVIHLHFFAFYSLVLTVEFIRVVAVFMFGLLAETNNFPFVNHSHLTYQLE